MLTGRLNWLWIGFLLLSIIGTLLVVYSVAYAKQNSEEKVITVTVRRFQYSPNIIEVNKGDRVRIRLISRDVYHGFYLDGYNMEMNVKRGERAELSFVADKAGRFIFRCSITCGDFHPYLIGYLRVMPNNIFYGGILGALSVAFIFVFGTMLMGRKQNSGNPAIRERLLNIFPLEWRFELTKFKVIRQSLKSRWFPFIVIVIGLFIFTLIMLSAIVGSPAGNYNFSLMILWILWWVLLIVVLVPFFGRLWCGICPLPSIGEWLQRLRFVGVRDKLGGLNKKWPRRLSNMWILNFLFVVMIFFSGFFTVRPMATFYLLTVIIAGSLAVSLIYQRRTFCRYLCPVNGFQGLYSNFSMSEIRPKDHEICRKHKPKTCYTGNEKGYGCPWLSVPSSLERNTYCGMCFECFKTCPYDNMAWNIRPPGVDLVAKARHGLDEAWNALIMLGLAVVFYLVMLGPWGFLKDWARAGTFSGFLIYLGGIATLILLLMPLLFFIFVYLSRKLSNDKRVPLKEVFINFSYPLVPLGLAAWIAFSLGKILPNGSYLINVLSDPFAWGWNLFGTAEFKWQPFLTGLMPYLQIFVLIAGLIFALEYGYKIAKRVYIGEKESKRGWLPMLMFFLGITIFLIWLYTW